MDNYNIGMLESGIKEDLLRNEVLSGRNNVDPITPSRDPELSEDPTIRYPALNWAEAAIRTCPTKGTKQNKEPGILVGAVDFLMRDGGFTERTVERT